MARVSFTSKGSAVVEVLMKFKDSSKNLSNYYIIDTGATCTTINRVQLHKLGYDDNWIRSTGEKLPENECPILADKRRATD